MKTPQIKLGTPQQTKNNRQGLKVTSIRRILKLNFWLMISHAIIGRIRQKTPKITEAAIIERERFFAPKNSPRYAKMIEVEPEMQSPLRKRKIIICHKLLAKLERKVVKKAVKAATIRVFRLPYKSPRIPHECDVKIIPNK
jgi:hypothetical protein